MSVILLKQGALCFWALWLTIVFLSNLCDLLKQLGLLRADWKFASGNYDFVRRTTARYNVSESVVRVLFMGVVVWEALAALLMIATLVTFQGTPTGTLYTAFAASLGLWAAFMIADELCVAYEPEPIHTGILIAQLVTLIAICLLP